MFKLKSVLTATFILVALLGATQLVVANGMSTEGQRVRELEEQKSKLQDEIRGLGKEVAALGSLARVGFRAGELGFFYNPKAFEYLSPPKLAQAK